ncbi:hypothetical protein A8B75_12295 [Sphingomonadales bacterium EhC05]|nr:hypothetical protein A8B75_12295 [Sphingomonadales bacterium EhC05]
MRLIDQPARETNWSFGNRKNNRALEMKNGSAMRDHLDKETVLTDRDSSYWLKMIIETGCNRDPLDVVTDLDWALSVFENWFRSIIADTFPAQTETI